MLCLRNSVATRRCADLEGKAHDCLFVEARLPGMRGNTVIGVVYGRRQANLWSLTAEAIQRAADYCTAQHCSLLLLGDFNARHTSWGDAKDSVEGNRLVSLCTRLDLTVLNTLFCPGESTFRRTDSILDLAI